MHERDHARARHPQSISHRGQSRDTFDRSRTLEREILVQGQQGLHSRVGPLTADARITSAFTIIVLGAGRCDQLFRGTGFILGRLLWCKGACGAWNDDSIADGSLQEPMFVAFAGDSRINTSLAQIEVAILANPTMIVLIRDRHAAIVAINGVAGRWEVGERRKCWKAEEIGMAISKVFGRRFNTRGVDIKGTRDGTCRSVWACLLE